jgi:hypothetical protein
MAIKFFKELTFFVIYVFFFLVGNIISFMVYLAPL